MKIEIAYGTIRLAPENEAEKCQMKSIKDDLKKFNSASTAQWETLDILIPLSEGAHETIALGERPSWEFTKS